MFGGVLQTREKEAGHMTEKRYTELAGQVGCSRAPQVHVTPARVVMIVVAGAPAARGAQEVDRLPAGAATYVTVGRAFVLTPREEVRLAAGFTHAAAALLLRLHPCCNWSLCGAAAQVVASLASTHAEAVQKLTVCTSTLACVRSRARARSHWRGEHAWPGAP